MYLLRLDWSTSPCSPDQQVYTERPPRLSTMSAQPGYPALGPAINSDGQYVQSNSSYQDPTAGNSTSANSNTSTSEPYHLGSSSQPSNVQGPNELSNALFQGAMSTRTNSKPQQDKLDQQVLVGQVLAEDIRNGATIHVSPAFHTMRHHNLDVWFR